MDFEKGDRVYKYQPVFINIAEVGGAGINGKVIGADFEKNTILIEVEAPARIVKSLEQKGQDL